MKIADVVVVGGGVIGAAVAYYLSDAGVKVVLVEQGEIAAGASGACDGFLVVQSKAPGIPRRIARASLEIYTSLEDELEFDLEYRCCGSVVIAENYAEMEALRGHVDSQSGEGLPVKLLEQREIRSMLPHINPRVEGGAYCSSDASVNPLRVVYGFARAAAARGGSLLCGCRVTGILVKGRRACGVQTTSGDIAAGAVIDAAGAWAPFVGRMAGVDIPIRPRRGQVLVTEAVPPLVEPVVLSSRYLVAKHGEGDKLGLAFTLEQTARGNLLLGSTREFAGYDCRVTARGMRAIARESTRIFPRLEGIHVIRSFAGLRPYSSTGLPFLGRVGAVENLFLAAGHEGDGITLAPLTAQIIRDMVLNRPPVFPLHYFTFPEER